MSGMVDLVASEDVAPGTVVPVSVHELDLVVWRTEAGAVCVMDARCTHQWTHLGAEGAVADDEIVCLAHFWQFDTEGRGVKVAMNGRRDRKGDIGVYETEEVDGRVLARIPPSGA